MEDMIARELDTGCFSESLGIANDTVIIIFLFKGNLWVFFDTGLIQARQAFLFSIEPNAGMSTGENLVTRFIHQFDALSLATHVAESRFHRGRGTHHLTDAEPALPGFFELFELLTGLALVVGLGLTLSTEILVASSTADSVFTHMHS
jgi:hypothetical protein